MIEEERKDQEQQNVEEVGDESETAVEEIVNQELAQEGLGDAKVDLPNIVAEPQVNLLIFHENISSGYTSCVFSHSGTWDNMVTPPLFLLF